MDEDAPHTMRWPRVFARLAGAMALALALYVLSPGPLGYVLFGRSKELDGAVARFYTPLRWLDERTGLLRTLERYYQWWYRLPGGAADRSKSRLANPGSE